LRILQIGTRDSFGGAARAAYRLHKGLRAIGADSTYFVRDQAENDPSVRRFIPDPSPAAQALRAGRKAELTAAYDTYAATRSPDIELFSQERVDGDLNFFVQRPPADVINLHWSAGFLDYPLFFDSARTKVPVVWTLHDMNAFTGGCHYDQMCGLFRTSCGPCPQLGSSDPHDLSRRVFDAKAKLFAAWPEDRLQIVAPSQWLVDEAKSSALFGKFPGRRIPYGIETETFKPMDKAAARAALNLPQDARIVLFVANHIRIARKGFRELVHALSLVPDADKLMLIGVGDSHVLSVHAPFKIGQLAFVADDAAMARIYAAADVTAMPSRQDNSPNTVLESLACGTPVVGFAVGGVPEVVASGEHGFLAAPGNVAGLSLAFMEAFADMERLKACGVRGRALVARNHTLAAQAESYAALYRDLAAADKARRLGR
jgi:glycosyltransferase involved in cell wall biosynthesis